MAMKNIKSYKKVIRFDENTWDNIEEFFQNNFTKSYTIIVLHKDLGIIKEDISYVYGYAKKNADNIKSIELYGENGDEKMKMTLHATKNRSPVSLQIEGAETSKQTEENAKSAAEGMWAKSRKRTTSYLAILTVFGVGVYYTMDKMIEHIIHKNLLAFALTLLSCVPFWFMAYIFDYIVQRTETGDEWIQFWVDEKHIEKYESMHGWKMWQYIIMGIAALSPFALWLICIR